MCGLCIYVFTEKRLFFFRGLSQRSFSHRKNGFLERAVNIARDSLGKNRNPFLCAVRDIIERMCLLMNLTQLSFLALRTNSIRSSPPLSRARVDVVLHKRHASCSMLFPRHKRVLENNEKKEHTFFFTNTLLEPATRKNA